MALLTHLVPVATGYRCFCEGFKNVSDVTDDAIKARLTEISSGSKPVSFDEVLADVKRNVRHDAAEHDACIRILMLQASYAEHCKRRGWDFANNAPEVTIKHIIAMLLPPALKPRVEDTLLLEKNNPKEDFSGFSDYLAENAEIHESFHLLNSYRALQKDVRGKKNEVLTDT